MILYLVTPFVIADEAIGMAVVNQEVAGQLNQALHTAARLFFSSLRSNLRGILEL